MSEEELPEGWRTLPLDEVASVEDGRRAPLNSEQRATRRGTYPYYGANGQVDSIDDYRYEGDHVLVAEDGGYYDDPSRAVAYLASGRFWVNNHAHVLSAKPGVDPVFLRDALNRVPWMEFVSGTTRLKLTQAALRRVHLQIAPLDEQRRIVAKLDVLRARSRRAKHALDAVPALLDRLRQSILAAAFGGDLTADWREQNPDVEPASELLKRIRIERRKRWEEAELAKLTAKGKPPKDDRWKDKYVEPEPVDETDLPDLPEGWCWASVDECCYGAQIGLVRSAAEQSQDAGHPYVRMQHYDIMGRWTLRDLTRVSVTKAEAAEFELRPGDVLFNTRNSAELVGKTAVWSGPSGHVFNNNLMRLQAVPPLTGDWLAQQMVGPSFRRGLDSVVAATTSIAAIYGRDLFRQPVAVAPELEMRTATAAVAAACRGIEQLDAHLRALAVPAIDSAILAAAFRGELLEAR